MGDYMKIKGKSLSLLSFILLFITLALIVFIFSNSFQNSEISGNSSGFITDLLNRICSSLKLKIFLSEEIVRTMAHFCEFGLLGVMALCTSLSFFGVKLQSFLISISVFCVTAVTDECIQLFSDGRAFQLSDILIDISGGLLGATAVFLIALLIRNHKVKEL